MSKRRKLGDWVYLKPNSGWVSGYHDLKAELIDDQPDWSCMNRCEDEECMEWPNLLFAPNKDGVRYPAYHVNECEMLDKPAPPFRGHLEKLHYTLHCNECSGTIVT